MDNISNPIVCPRCQIELKYTGTKKIHEGDIPTSLIGGEFFEDKDRFDIYVCPRCGRGEFFVDGIGEEFRPR